LSDAEKDEAFHDTDEIKTARNEAPIPTGRLRELLNHLNITTHPEFRIKRVPHPGREEYKAIMEIFSGPNVLSRHKGPAFRATYQDAVVDAAWQVITTYNHRYHEELKNTIYHLLPQRKKNKFKTSGVKEDVPRMLMASCEASDLYASDTYTWSATSSGPGAKDELTTNNHSPFGSRTR
jgi:hypothetical protein